MPTRLTVKDGELLKREKEEDENGGRSRGWGSGISGLGGEWLNVEKRREKTKGEIRGAEVT